MVDNLVGFLLEFQSELYRGRLTGRKLQSQAESDLNYSLLGK